MATSPLIVICALIGAIVGGILGAAFGSNPGIFAGMTGPLRAVTSGSWGASIGSFGALPFFLVARNAYEEISSILDNLERH